MSDRPRPPRGGSDWRERVRSAFGATPRRSSSRTARALPRGSRYGQRERQTTAQRSAARGGQVRRETQYAPYVIGFLLIVAALGGFAYVGLNWATGPGRLAAVGSTPAAPANVAAVAPAPAAAPAATAVASPPPVQELTYVVKAGDNPAAIARQFNVNTDDLLALNGISDPRSLQIGQTLKIPGQPAPLRRSARPHSNRPPTHA